jgi:predicted nucleic-acid-binding protein
LIGIDTNILVRYIVQDDTQQAAIANSFLESLTPEIPGFIALVSIAELGWVLNRQYKLIRTQFTQVLQTLLDSPQLCLEDEKSVRGALLLFEQTNADFDDCLIACCAHSSGCDYVATFDKNAATALGMQLLH